MITSAFLSTSDNPSLSICFRFSEGLQEAYECAMIEQLQIE